MDRFRRLWLWAAGVAAMALFASAAAASGVVSPYPVAMVVAETVSFTPLHGFAPDCALYPPPAPSPFGFNGRPHFPYPGCTHTPDRGALDRCTGRFFSSRGAVQRCIDQAMRPCRNDQMDVNLCVGNLHAYLDETVRRRLRANARAPLLDPAGYDAWVGEKAKGCEATSDYSPGGSGYAADIALCLSYETMRLLQTRLIPMSEPFRQAATPR